MSQPRKTICKKMENEKSVLSLLDEVDKLELLDPKERQKYLASAKFNLMRAIDILVADIDEQLAEKKIKS